MLDIILYNVETEAESLLLTNKFSKVILDLENPEKYRPKHETENTAIIANLRLATY